MSDLTLSTYYPVRRRRREEMAIKLWDNPRVKRENRGVFCRKSNFLQRNVGKRVGRISCLSAYLGDTRLGLYDQIREMEEEGRWPSSFLVHPDDLITLPAGRAQDKWVRRSREVRVAFTSPMSSC